MLKKLQQKWKVSGLQAFLILCVFAVTGTLTAYISKAITGWVGFNADTHWAAKTGLRLAVLLFGYQAILLLTAFLFGQFHFFWMFEKKILQRIGLVKKDNPEKRDDEMIIKNKDLQKDGPKHEE